VIAYVTGAAGFLGSHLVDKLLTGGAGAVGSDNFATGSRANLSAALFHADFTLVEADVAQPWDGWIAGLPETRRRPELILHFASPSSPVDYGNDPLGTMAVNALGTMHACELARRTGARVVVASTSECYGDPLEHPQRETYWGNVDPVGARACYDESKRYAEAYLTSAVRVNAVDGRLVRIFNTYGPRLRPGDGRVIPNFCSSALKGEAPTIYGNGGQTRSFLLRRRSDRRHLPPRDTSRARRARRRPDIALARALLDWEPHVSLRDGLLATLAYFRES
jgi:dTDP-glucose 4,6-dehydratase